MKFQFLVSLFKYFYTLILLIYNYGTVQLKQLDWMASFNRSKKRKERTIKTKQNKRIKQHFRFKSLIQDCWDKFKSRATRNFDIEKCYAFLHLYFLKQQVLPPPSPLSQCDQHGPVKTLILWIRNIRRGIETIWKREGPGLKKYEHPPWLGQTRRRIFWDFKQLECNSTSRQKTSHNTVCNIFCYTTPSTSSAPLTQPRCQWAWHMIEILIHI